VRIYLKQCNLSTKTVVLMLLYLSTSTGFAGKFEICITPPHLTLTNYTLCILNHYYINQYNTQYTVLIDLLMTCSCNFSSRWT